MDDRDIVIVGSATDVGRVRSRNEDNLAYVEPPDPALLARLGRLILVADGMGGAAGGALASQIVVGTIGQAYFQYPGADPKEGLVLAFLAANQAVHDHADRNPELRGMGATCVALALRGNTAHVVHVGDSMVYLVRDGRILQLNDDHKKVSQLVRDGFITAAEAANHPERNVLLKVIGAKPVVEPDAGVPPVECRSGDRFVLCSDGLYDLVSLDEIRDTVLSLPPQAAAASLVNQANERGGTDNVTVQVVQVGAGQPGPAGAYRRAAETLYFTRPRQRSWAIPLIGLGIVAVSLVALALAFVVFRGVGDDPGKPDAIMGRAGGAGGSATDVAPDVDSTLHGDAGPVAPGRDAGQADVPRDSGTPTKIVVGPNKVGDSSKCPVGPTKCLSFGKCRPPNDCREPDRYPTPLNCRDGQVCCVHEENQRCWKKHGGWPPKVVPDTGTVEAPDSGPVAYPDAMGGNP